MKKYIIALSVLFLALTVNAQEVIWKLTYDVGIPFADTKEFTDQASWRGLTFDFDRVACGHQKRVIRSLLDI